MRGCYMVLGPTHIAFNTPPHPKLLETPASTAPSPAIPQPPPVSWHSLLSDKSQFLACVGDASRCPQFAPVWSPHRNLAHGYGQGPGSVLALGSAKGQTGGGGRGGEQQGVAQLRQSLVLQPWASLSTFLNLTVPICEVGRTGLPSRRVVRVT